MPEAPEAPLARFWWLRRASVAAIALLFALLLTWVILDQYAARRVRDRLATYRAAGEPVTPEDVPMPQADPETNAARLYQRAVTQLGSAESPRQSANEYDYELPPPPQWMEMARKAVEASADAIRTARVAAEQPQVDWGTRLKSPLITVGMPNLGPQRNLANMLADAAVYQHALGNEREALALYHNILHQADSLRAEPLIISQLVGMGIEGLGHSALGQFAGELRIDDGTDAALTRDEVRQLINQLLRRPVRDLRPSLQVERLQLLDLYETTYSRRYTTRPLARADVAQVLQWLDTLADASQEPSLREALNRVPNGGLAEEHRKMLQVAGKLPVSKTLHSLRSYAISTRLLQPPYRLAASRRVLAIQLALRLYHLDHGRYPETLDALVPTYLTGVPDDPMSGMPFTYILADDGRRPLLVSLGIDGKVSEKSDLEKMPARAQWDWRTNSDPEGESWYDLSAWKSGEPRIWKEPDNTNWNLPPGLFGEGDEDADHPDDEGNAAEPDDQ